MATMFWQPGTRCLVRRDANRTVVDVTSTKDNAGRCSVKVQWQGCNERGLAVMPPLSICSGSALLSAVSSGDICEGRLILPPISDDIWPRCYLSIELKNDVTPALDVESAPPIEDDPTGQT